MSSTYDISIPHANDVPKRKFAHQQAIDPAKSKLNKINSLRLDVRVELRINPSDKLLHLLNLPMYTRLCVRVVVLYGMVSAIGCYAWTLRAG